MVRTIGEESKMKFDENGNRIPKLTKEEIKSKISQTRSELITENYTCRSCGGKLEIVILRGLNQVRCTVCKITTDNKTLREWVN